MHKHSSQRCVFKHSQRLCVSATDQASFIPIPEQRVTLHFYTLQYVAAKNQFHINGRKAISKADLNYRPLTGETPRVVTGE